MGWDRVHRYFFHTDDGRPFHDDDGTLLENDGAARIEAARVLGQLVNDHPDDIWHDDPFRMTVTNDTGVILFVLDIAALTSPASSLGRAQGRGG